MTPGPKDVFGRYAWGVLVVDRTQIYYEQIDEWIIETRQGPAGGELRIPVKTSRRVWQACELGHAPAPVNSPELLAAIADDQARQQDKHYGE